MAATKKAAAKKTTPAKKAAVSGTTVDEQKQIEKQAEHAEEHPEQHPAFEGAPEVEVAKRSQDETKVESGSFRKDFVLLKAAWEGTVDKEPAHKANIEASRNFLMSQGLRPTGDGKFSGEEKHPDGKSVILHYNIPATPAVTATEETVQHAHVTLEDQHAAEGNPDKSEKKTL